jgi:hypothetical protein
VKKALTSGLTLGPRRGLQESFQNYAARQGVICTCPNNVHHFDSRTREFCGHSTEKTSRPDLPFDRHRSGCLFILVLAHWRQEGARLLDIPTPNSPCPTKPPVFLAKETKRLELTPTEHYDQLAGVYG